MLDRHPQIAIAGEFEFLVDAMSPDGRFMKRDAFVNSLALNRVFQRHGLTIAPGLNFTGLAHDFLEQVGAGKDAAIVGATVHRHFDRLLWLWPDARFIHLIRDGRDVALTTIPIGQAGNMWRGIRWWVEGEKLWERMAHKLPIDRQLTIQYEKLTRDPEQELRRVARFLGIEYSPDMLRYDATSLQAAPHGNSAGKWRDRHPSDIAAAEHRASRWLLQNGYVLSGSVRPPSLLRVIQLRLQDRYAVAKYRRKLLGPRLWFRSLYVTRFGSRRAKTRIAQEMYAAADPHLRNAGRQ